MRRTGGRHVVLGPRLVQQPVDLVPDLLLRRRLALDVHVAAEDRSLLGDLLERADNLVLRLVRSLVDRGPAAARVARVALLVGERAGLDRVLLAVLGAVPIAAHLVRVEPAGLDGLLHVLGGRRGGRERERRVGAFGDADDVENELRVGRDAGEEGAVCGVYPEPSARSLPRKEEAKQSRDALAKVDLFLPVGHLFLEQVERAEEERLSEEGDPKAERGGHRPHLGGDDGKDERDRGEDLVRELFARLVRRVRLGRGEGTAWRFDQRQ